MLRAFAPYLVAFAASFAPLSQYEQIQIANAERQNPGYQQNESSKSAAFKIAAEPENATHEASNSKSNRHDEWFDGWSLSDKIAAIVAAAAFIQAIALICTVGIMIRNGRRQLRAYVFPNDATLAEGMMLEPPRPEHQNEPGIILNFRNSGQTPAYKVVSWGEIKVLLATEETSLRIPKKLERKFASNIGPNGIMPKAQWSGRCLTEEEIGDLTTAKRVIFYHGRIEYVDAFGRKRWTNFRLRYAGQFPPPKGVIFNFCEKGNDAR